MHNHLTYKDLCIFLYYYCNYLKSDYNSFMKVEREITDGAFKAIEVEDSVPQIKRSDLLTSMVVKNEPPEGTENLLCVVAVSSIGEIDIITKLNDDVKWFLSDDGPGYIEQDFDETPGIYLVEFWIDGSGPDYNGEYDSWSEFGEIIKYKVDVPDKRKDQFSKEGWDNTFENKIYNDPGSEYPRLLIIVNDSGTGFILDVINEDKAYKSVIKEAVYMMDELGKGTGLQPLVLYEATISIVGDMENLLDRDLNEDIKFSNIKRIPLMFGERIERISHKERNKKDLAIFCKYIDELRMGDEHIQ